MLYDLIPHLSVGIGSCVLSMDYMKQSYCLISSWDLERIDEMLVRAINVCANPRPFSQCSPEDECTASYSGAYGYSYSTLKSIKEHIDTARPYDPSLSDVPF